MDALQEIRDAFAASSTGLKALHTYLSGHIGAYCEDRGYTMKSRPKTLPSIAAKLQQGRYASWADLDDLVAFTVVVPTRSHEMVVLNWLHNAFEHIETRSRETAQKPPDTFRFDATRWYGRISESASALPELEGIRRFLFEVQIRTVFDDAWGVVTHDLVYKGDDPAWGRARLASQLKAAVEQIEELVENFESSAERLPRSPHRETELFVAATATLEALFQEGLIDEDLRPSSWASLTHNLWAFSCSQPTPDGEGRRNPQRVFPRLIKHFDQSVRDGEFEPLLSTTLFDSVVVCAMLANKAVDDDFYLVDSDVLTKTFGLRVSKAIDLNPAFGQPG